MALLDPDDERHAECSRALDEVRFPLATTAAVVAELFHFYGGRADRLRRAWALVRSTSVVVLPIDGKDLHSIERMMLQYVNVPMDFADATLVRLAEREALATVLTMDSDFLIYRVGGRKRFDCLPR